MYANLKALRVAASATVFSLALLVFAIISPLRSGSPETAAEEIGQPRMPRSFPRQHGPATPESEARGAIERSPLAEISPVPEQAAVQARLDCYDSESAQRAELRNLLESGKAPHDIPAALAFLQACDETEDVRELTVGLVRQWAELDVRAAADWAGRMPTEGLRREALVGVAIQWAEQDLEGAVDWATRLPKGEDADRVLLSVAYEASRTDPLLALEVAECLPANPDRNALVQHAVLQWAALCPVDAAQWANEIPDAVLRERMLSNIATVWGESDPVGAAQLALLAIAPGRAQDDAVIGIIQRWVQADPMAASDWVMAFPEGCFGELATDTILSLWPAESP